MTRLTARTLHSFVALSFSLILLFVALTGALAVYSLEIDWLVRPAMRVSPEAEGKRTLGDSLDAARAAEPDWWPVAIQRYPGARFADQLTLVAPDGATRLVWVDPYSATVQGTGSPNTVRTVLREMHRAFSSRRFFIQLAVTATCLPLAFAVVTGLWTQGRFWRAYLRMPRWSGSRRAVLSDLHRLIAVWSLPIVILVLATSLVFLSELVGFGPQMRPMPMASPPRELPLPQGFVGADLDRAVEAAEAALPGLAVEDIMLPRGGAELLMLRGPSGAVAVRPTASTVAVDPAEMGVVTVMDAADLGPHLRLFEAARVIHFGLVGGQATRLLWLLSGMGLVALNVLGAMIYAERMLKQSRRSRSRWGHWWAGQGWSGWIGAAALVFALGMTVRRLL